MLLLPLTFIQAGEQNPYEIPKSQVIPIKDSESGGQYELYIKLPEGYSENSDTRYPVIYFTDAVWHIEMLSASTAYLMEDSILVGISWQIDMQEELVKERGEHVSRFRDYSLLESSNAERQAKYQFGKASHHLAFIRNEVIKYVENNFRTDTDNRTYFGYSLGGVFGAYVLIAQPDTFKNYVLGSPSLRGDIPYLSELESKSEKKRKAMNSNVFISYGSSEKELAEYADKFIALLKNRNDKSISLEHAVIEGTHQTAFPTTAVRSVTWLSNLTKENK